MALATRRALRFLLASLLVDTLLPFSGAVVGRPHRGAAVGAVHTVRESDHRKEADRQAVSGTPWAIGPGTVVPR